MDKDTRVGGHGLVRLRATVGDCLRCPLHWGRRSVVFGSGDPNADLMVVGEAPGPLEDRACEPFAGKAGQMLDRLLMDALGVERHQVYVTHAVMCRTPGNRQPEPAEVSKCLPFLRQKIQEVQPRALLLLGSVATSAIVGQRVSVARESLHPPQADFGNAVIAATFHPAYLCRKPHMYDTAVSDVRRLMLLVRGAR